MSTYEKVRKTINRIFKRPKKVGIAFGGGNSRGAAHAGVLKVIVENKIPIDYIAGTSSGALIGALFAYGLNVYDLIHLAKNSDWLKTITRIKLFEGIWPVSNEGLEQFMLKHVGRKNIEDLRIPFCAVATDYMTGEKVLIEKGSLARAVHASSAVPGLFTPVEHQGRLLMDGMIVDNVPADVVRQMGADYVIAVDVVPNTVLNERPKNILQVIERAIDIASREQAKYFYKYADLVISPVVENIGPIDFGHGDNLVMEGENATKKVLHKIKKEIGIK